MQIALKNPRHRTCLKIVNFIKQATTRKEAGTEDIETAFLTFSDVSYLLIYECFASERSVLRAVFVL